MPMTIAPVFMLIRSSSGTLMAPHSGEIPRTCSRAGGGHPLQARPNMTMEPLKKTQDIPSGYD